MRSARVRIASVSAGTRGHVALRPAPRAMESKAAIEFFARAEIKARDSLLCESRPIWPISDDDMIMDDPPVLTPDQHLHTLEALQGTRQRALSTRNRQILM